MLFPVFVFPNSLSESIQQKNNPNPHEKKESSDYNYKSACVFSDFLLALLPPINEKLIKSKMTFELDNAWLLGVFGYDQNSKYFVSRTNKAEVYFIKNPKYMVFVEASIHASALPPQCLNPEYLSWIFEINKESLFAGTPTIGCENYSISFEFTPHAERKLNLVNIRSFIE